MNSSLLSSGSLSEAGVDLCLLGQVYNSLSFRLLIIHYNTLKIIIHYLLYCFIIFIYYIICCIALCRYDRWECILSLISFNGHTRWWWLMIEAGSDLYQHHYEMYLSVDIDQLLPVLNLHYLFVPIKIRTGQYFISIALLQSGIQLFMYI